MLGMITFIPALQLTSVSNVAIIIATGPFVAAAIAWIWLRERLQSRTLLAMLVAFCGVIIIVRRRQWRFRQVRDRAGLFHDPCDLGHDGAGAATQGHADGSRGGAVEHARQRNQPALCAGHHFDNRIRVRHAGDVRFCQVGLGLSLFVLGSRFLPSDKRP